jgi:hypothetical protein
MKISRNTLPFLLALVACSGAHTKIEDAVRNRLNDPESARFKGLVQNELGNKACIAWNAKNQLGGYGDWKYAELEYVNSVWTITNMEQDPRLCTAEFFRLRDELVKLNDELMHMDGVPENIRAQTEEEKNIKYYNPEMIGNEVAALKNYIRILKEEKK